MVMDRLDRSIADSAVRARDHHMVPELTEARAALVATVRDLTDAAWLADFRAVLASDPANALADRLPPADQKRIDTFTLWAPDHGGRETLGEEA